MREYINVLIAYGIVLFQLIGTVILLAVMICIPLFLIWVLLWW